MARTPCRGSTSPPPAPLPYRGICPGLGERRRRPGPASAVHQLLHGGPSRPVPCPRYVAEGGTTTTPYDSLALPRGRLGVVTTRSRRAPHASRLTRMLTFPRSGFELPLRPSSSPATRPAWGNLLGTANRTDRHAVRPHYGVTHAALGMTGAPSQHHSDGAGRRHAPGSGEGPDEWRRGRRHCQGREHCGRHREQESDARRPMEACAHEDAVAHPAQPTLQASVACKVMLDACQQCALGGRKARRCSAFPGMPERLTTWRKWVFPCAAGDRGQSQSVR